MPRLGVGDGRTRGQPRRLFANARVYAQDLDAVLAIAEWMRGSGLEVRTRAREIENVRAIERVLSFIFGVIAGIAVVGCGLSLGGSLWINADRKRHDLALLRLLGFVAHSVLIVPVVQALLIAAVYEGANGRIFNLGNHPPVSLLEFVQVLLDVCGEFGVGKGGYRLTAFPAEKKRIDIGDYYASFDRIKSNLGWEPTVPLREGLRRTVAYYLEHRDHYWQRS